MTKITTVVMKLPHLVTLIVCICVSFLYTCLTSETLHYPWIGIVQNMDWTGLDSWTGQLDWTVGLDSWTGQLDWDPFLLNRRNSMFLRKVK